MNQYVTGGIIRKLREEKAMTQQGIQVEKLYPEGNAQARFKISRTRKLYAYCNRHGLFECRIK